MLSRFRIQKVQHDRRCLNQRLHIRVFAVENAQRILLEAANTILIKLTFHAGKILDQGLTIASP